VFYFIFVWKRLIRGYGKPGKLREFNFAEFVSTLLVQKNSRYQVSALSPLLFVIVMEALSREFRVALTWELLYADDLAPHFRNILGKYLGTS